MSRIHSAVFSFTSVYLLSVVIAFLSFIPVSVRAPEIVPYPDKIFHSLAYLFLSCIALNASLLRQRSRPFVFAFSYAFALSVLIEVIQYFIPYRDFEGTDIIANFCGSAAGALICLTGKRKKTTDCC